MQRESNCRIPTIGTNRYSRYAETVKKSQINDGKTVPRRKEHQKLQRSPVVVKAMKTTQCDLYFRFTVGARRLSLWRV